MAGARCIVPLLRAKFLQEDKIQKLKKREIPNHIAIIMDGNGRWAHDRGQKRVKGHEAGANTVRTITTYCAKIGVKQLTLYALSVENWRERPKLELAFLMRLLKRFLKQERPTLMDNNIRFDVVGRIGELPASVRNLLLENVDMTAKNTGMIMRLALNYGGRAEIVDGAKRLIDDVVSGKIKRNKITERLFSNYLYTKGAADPDILIRTAGEMRISNFLLWQVSYSEIWVTPVCWPDFAEEHLEFAIDEYNRRVRKFGGLTDEELDKPRRKK